MGNKKSFKIHPRINISYINKELTHESIFERYINVPINKDTLISNSFSNPFRTDVNPSCNYWYSNNGKLRFRDWTEDRNYDVFDVVAKTLGVSTNDVDGMILVLHDICKNFRINIYENYENVLEYERNIKKGKSLRKKRRKRVLIYRVRFRKHNYHDVDYFKNMGLDIEDTFGMYLIQEIYVSEDNVNFKKIYSYHYKDLCIGYYGGKIPKNNIDKWKFYFPFRSKTNRNYDGSYFPKFITNSVFMQGIQYMKPARFCVITKSFKDSKIFNKIGIQSSALSAESIMPFKREVNFLKNNYDYIFSCMDFDLTGVRMSNKLRKQHNVEPIMFTNGKFNTKDYKAKDASDFTTLTHSTNNLKLIIKNIYKSKIDLALKFEEELKEKLKFTRYV